MTNENVKYLKGIIDDEGLCYAIIDYSSFSEIEDDEFHKLRKAFDDTYHNLEKYINSLEIEEDDDDEK